MVKEIRLLAESAGREIMKIYRANDAKVSFKDDRSPLTEADLKANEIILDGLAKLTSERVFSEESESLPTSVSGEEAFWLVDPLDGTRDFVGRRDTFVVCIARVEENFPVFGLIHWPVSGETWWAESRKGAFRQDGERLMHRGKRTALIAAGSRSDPSERMKMFYERYAVSEVQRFGSALKFCKLAEGAIDLYPRFGPSSEWDTAAGQVIAEEAGCKVISVATGERLRYGKPGFTNGGFIASRSDLDIVSSLRASGLIKH